jgi:GNAT superfamily N-acetyltransferase
MSQILNEIRWTTLTDPYFLEYSDVLDRAFDVPTGGRYLDDFPIWNPATPMGDSRYQLCGWRGNRLVSTASIRFARYKWLSGDETPMGLIGAVATHPEFVRRGLASEAMGFLLQEGLRRKVEVFALWGAESSVYSRKQFKFGGKQVRVPLSSLSLRKAGSEGLTIKSGYSPEIVSILRSRESGLIYSAGDRTWIDKHKNTEWRTAWRGNQCVAYVAWNRGIDLKGIIHEAEGNDDALIAILSGLKSSNPSLELLVHPTRVADFCEEGVSIPESGEFLAQFRVQPGAIFSEIEMDSIWLSGMDSC